MTKRTKSSAKELPELQLGSICEDNLSFFPRLIPESLHGRVRSGELLAIGALEEGTPCAALVFEPSTETVIRSLFVAPANRRRHIATTLVAELVDFLSGSAELGVQSVYAEFEGEEARALFLSMGFAVEELGGRSVAVTLSELSETVVAREPSLPEKYVLTPFSALTSPQLRILNRTLEQRELNFTGAPVTKESVLPEGGCVCWSGREPVGCVCFAPESDGTLLLTVFFTTVSDSAPSLSMLHSVWKKLLAAYPPQTRVLLPLLTSGSQALADRILDGHGSLADLLYCARLTF